MYKYKLVDIESGENLPELAFILSKTLNLFDLKDGDELEVVGKNWRIEGNRVIRINQQYIATVTINIRKLFKCV